eukprot:6712834-Lingulodinium_polyedra.AAC.1
MAAVQIDTSQCKRGKGGGGNPRAAVHRHVSMARVGCNRSSSRSSSVATVRARPCGVGRVPTERPQRTIVR